MIESIHKLMLVLGTISFAHVVNRGAVSGGLGKERRLNRLKLFQTSTEQYFDSEEQTGKADSTSPSNNKKSKISLEDSSLQSQSLLKNSANGEERAEIETIKKWMDTSSEKTLKETLEEMVEKLQKILNLQKFLNKKNFFDVLALKGFRLWLGASDGTEKNPISYEDAYAIFCWIKEKKIAKEEIEELKRLLRAGENLKPFLNFNGFYAWFYVLEQKEGKQTEDTLRKRIKRLKERRKRGLTSLKTRAPSPNHLFDA